MMGLSMVIMGVPFIVMIVMSEVMRTSESVKDGVDARMLVMIVLAIALVSCGGDSGGSGGVCGWWW